METLTSLGSHPSPVERESPDWVRISYASALALRFKSGRFARDFDFGGINLLLNYGVGCQSDCAYCGLARSRSGAYEDKSFIRVDWPLVSTDDLIERMDRYESRLTRLCISMVTHGRSFPDTLEITRRIRNRVATPLSILVAPPGLDELKLRAFQAAGVDMIGIGMDTVTEELFRSLRSDVPRGGLDWAQYWRIVDQAREIFGPWKVNCHTLLGLGETDRQLMSIFERLLDRQVFSYLFNFNPEPESRMAGHPQSPIERWRRIQLAKFLLEEKGVDPAAFSYDEEEALTGIAAPETLVEEVVRQGWAFMTNGCPGPAGEPGCTRPMGSWRPGDEPRDYPWRPASADLPSIYGELRLEQLLRPGPAAAKPPDRCAPPVAGRSG